MPRQLEVTDEEFHDLAILLNDGRKPLVKVKRETLWRFFRDYQFLMGIAGKEVRPAPRQEASKRVRRVQV